MDFDLKQWKVQQQQSEESLLQPCAKIPRLQSSLLPFFVPEPCTNLSAFLDSTDTRFSGLGCFFSLAQRQELELQALIFKYMLVNAPIPPELLLPIKTSLLHRTSPASSACFLYPYQQYQHYQQPMLHSGYWGKSLIDPEPGRCRRTDGKKWRCAREVVLGHKYCERHVHRGRNRSRKLVENATPIATKGDTNNPTPLAHLPIAASKCANLVQLNQRGLEERRGNVDIQNGKLSGDESGAEGQLLRQFFDDWPRPNENSNGVGGPSTTGISISSTPSSDTEFSLKLSTGNVDDTVNGGEEASPQLDWGTGWSGHQASSMGGPLAEALRSSITNASPTSVLYTGTASETSSATT